jgi:hypothetical protein
MATTTKPTTESKPAKVKRDPVKLAERIKKQLNQAALGGKITVDEIQDLQAHLGKVAGLLA